MAELMSPHAGAVNILADQVATPAAPGTFTGPQTATLAQQLLRDDIAPTTDQPAAQNAWD